SLIVIDCTTMPPAASSVQRHQPGPVTAKLCVLGGTGGLLSGARCSIFGLMRWDVPLFVELCEAVAAEIDVKRRWLGEQGRRVSFCFGALPERHVALEVACEPSVVGSHWLLPA